eukprot:SAG31_NODE_633_length_13382_cov_11.528911_5_plen_46_part_00
MYVVLLVLSQEQEVVDCLQMLDDRGFRCGEIVAVLQFVRKLVAQR